MKRPGWVNIDFIVGFSLLGLVVGGVILGPLLWPVDPYHQSIAHVFQPPLESGEHGNLYPLGSDQLGRDLLARIIAGTRTSLVIVTLAMLIAAPLGVAGGVLAGFFGRWTDATIMRLVDIQLAIPFILLVMMIVAVLGSGMANLIIVLGITGWAVYARVARGQVLSIKNLEYIEAAQALGSSRLRLILRHILPNIMTPLIVLITLDLPRLVILESAMGFLGLGVQPPTPTLGNLLGEGQAYIFTSWWLVVFPGTVIAMLVVAFNLIGDWLVQVTNARIE